MGILSSLFGSDDPFTADTDPVIEPTPGPALDSQAIPLMLLGMFDYSHREGYPHHETLALHTFMVEERLEDNGINVDRYEWEPVERPQHPIPESEQFYADLYDGYTQFEDGTPVVRTRDTTTYGGHPVRYYSVTGYTDVLISRYFEHAEVDYETVESIIREHIEEYNGPVSNVETKLRANITERYPSKYF